MKIDKFLESSTRSLEGKCVVLSGASGGLGRVLSRRLASLKAKLILLNKSPKKAAKLMTELVKEFPEADIRCFSADFEDIAQVKALCERLEEFDIDYLIHNAGAYALPRRKSALGLDNVFQINFLSPYYITKRLMPKILKRRGKIIITGSIAYSAVRADMEDVDFSGCSSPAEVYGNSKRFLMFSHIMLALAEPKLNIGIAHPGICPTGITSNYALPLRALIKLPMKLSFMDAERACLPILNAVFKDSLHYSWIGPRFFNIWGMPALDVLKGCDEKEQKFISDTAERLAAEMDKI